MSIPPLDESLTRDVLDYLGVDALPPSPGALDALMAAYVRRVPWESVARIVKRARTANTADCPRWPDEFWRDAITRGTGGTCFESNYAFFSLLRRLGFDGYLTVNNMGETIGCHTAIVVTPGDGSRRLVDVGLPLHLPVPLDSSTRTERTTPFHTYSATPDGNGHFSIDRDRHPQPNCFTLIDTPVDHEAYRAALTADYGDGGLFLDRVIVVRVVDEQVWRFSGEGLPYQLETFRNGDKTYYYLGDDPQSAARHIAAKFGMDEELVAAALETVTST
jgi:hypothetical protein